MTRYASMFLATLLFFAASTAVPTKSMAQAVASTSRIPDVIDEHSLITLKGNVPSQARLANDRGQAAASLPMNRIVLVLKRSDSQEKALQSAIQAMHDPKSAQFHKWLTPDQFGKTYGTSDADIAKINGWLAAHGFQVNHVAKGRGTIEFSGSADAVASTFHTQIHSYVVNGQQHYANSADPQIPSTLAPVVAGVLSLHNFTKQSSARILGQSKIGKERTPLAPAASAAKGGLKPEFTNGGTNFVGPGDLWTIYNATPLITASSRIDGAGQTIAIVGRSDIDSNDLLGFRTNFLPAPYASTFPFTQISNGPDPGINDDRLEQSLDVEYSSALAPAAQINLVVSGSTNSTDGVDLSAEYIVDNNLASVMSTSYGLCEAAIGSGNQFYNDLWQQAAAQGITSMVSAGDNGSAGCDIVGPSGSDTFAAVADEGLQVSGVASTPYNIAVGGNEFTDDSSTYWDPSNSSTVAPHTSALSYIPEEVWNESCSPLVCGTDSASIPAGSGGASGCFNPTFDANNNITACTGGYPAPDWQNGVAGLPNDNKRHLPDVSLTASGHDGYIVCLAGSCDSGGFYGVGGTSASSPAFAGIMALVNQKTGSRQGQANYTLYRLAASEYGPASGPNTANLSACNATKGNAVDNSCIFHDVTTGTNAVPCDGGTLDCDSTTTGVLGTLTAYKATAGYDSATGLGSMNVANLVNHWNDAGLTATSTALTLGATTSTFGSPIAINAAVSPATGTGTPTGSVALLTDSTLPGAIGAGSLSLTNGAFSGNVNSLPGGTYHVSARYSGDGNFSSSISTGSSIVVNPAASVIKLAIVGTDPVTGAAVTGTALPYGSIVNGNVTLNGVAGLVAPSGSVSFFSGSSSLTTVQSSPDGTISYASVGIGLGSYSWSATYAGNTNYNGSTSSAAPFTVVPAASSLKLLANTSFVIGTASANLTAIVAADSLLLNPTGTVTFTVNGKNAGTAAVAAYTDPSTQASGGKATLALDASLLNAGANILTASYTGDGNYIASNSQSLSIGYSATAVVNAIAFKAVPTAATTHQPVTLTASITNGVIAATAGSVEFFDGAVSLGSVQVAGSAAASGHTTGDASLKLMLAPGTHNLSAIYHGILAAPTPVTSTAASVSVTGTLPSATSITAGASTANPTNYDLAATVSAFGLKPSTAKVDFSETSVVADLGSATVDATTATQTFLSPTFYNAGDPTAASPSVSVVADFNGDGIADIATANGNFTNGSMSILIGKGDGTFQKPVVYATAPYAVSINLGDFNNDGIVDAAVTTQYDSSFLQGTIYVFLGNGDGTFQAPIVTTETNGLPVQSVVADFNRDGILDIASTQAYPNQVSVFFGNGDGTFLAPINYAITASVYAPISLAEGDFNGDGAIDFIEGNGTDNTAGLFLNNGDGTFTVSTYLNVADAEWISVADLNADGKQDLVLSDYGYTQATVLLGKGDGTFADGVSYPLDGYTGAFDIGDVDGDGKLDIVGGIFYPVTGSGVGVLKGNGDGTFQAAKDYATNQGHGYGVTIADLNGDGTPDIISSDINNGDPASQGIAILLNVNQAKATLSNVAVAGPTSVKQEIQGLYGGDSNYVASSSAGIFVNGSGAKSTPAILWTPASPWGAGVALGSSVLNAATDGNVAGSFTYTAQSGTAAAVSVTAASTLDAGTYTVVATFTPVDTTDYTPATATRTVVIQAASFTLETATPSLTLTAGASGTFSVSAPALYGFAGTIVLTPGTNLPGGFTVTASPASITAGETSTITVKTTGLSGSVASIHSASPWLSTGGVILSCFLLFPIVRRRKSLVLMIVGSIATITALTGCGGSNFSTATVTVASSSTKVASGSAVALTATVSSKQSKPGGTVTFFNGSTALGSAAAVTNGTATLSISTLPVGLGSITSVYSGDQHDSGATSSAVAQLVTGQTTIEVDGTANGVTHAIVIPVTLQ